MPPKVKFTKEQIIYAGLKIVERDGVEAVTARAVAANLGCSVAPIFSVFENMDDLQGEIISAAKGVYAAYVAKGLKAEIAFKGVGMEYIRFAIERPNLFRLLFMSKSSVFGIENILMGVEDSYCEILNSVSESYGFGVADSKKLYQHMWIYTHGIAVLCVTGTGNLSMEEISGMLTEVCASLIRDMKRGVK